MLSCAQTEMYALSLFWEDLWSTADAGFTITNLTGWHTCHTPDLLPTAWVQGFITIFWEHWNQIYDSKLPREREPYASNRFLQLTARLHYNGIIWLALSSINIDFLIQICYFWIKYLPNCPHEAGWTPFQAWSKCKMVDVPGIDPATAWSVFRHADP